MSAADGFRAVGAGFSSYLYSSSFKCEVSEIFVSSLYEATESELQGFGMAISKNTTRVLKVAYFEITACPPTLTLKFKVLILEL